MTQPAPSSRESSWGATIVLIGIVLAGFSHGGCDSKSVGSGGVVAGQGLYLVELILNGDTISVQAGAAPITLTSIGYYSDGSLQAEAVTWSLSPPGFASLAGNQLSGVQVGLTFLTATAISNPAVSTTVIVNVTATPPANPTISTLSLPSGTVAVGYGPAQVNAVNGHSPFTWSLKSGSLPLPPGLFLNASTGAIYGTPTTAGTFGFTVMVTDSVGATDDQNLTITINPPSSSSGSTTS